MTELWIEEDELSYQIGFDKPIFETEKPLVPPVVKLPVDDHYRPAPSTPFYEHIDRSKK